MAVMWEITLLARAGKINLRRTPRAFFGDLFSNAAYQPYELSQEQVFDADELRFNRDPFDALIVASARALALPLVTRDVDILGSGAVKTIW
jgi:PIN domain nuclease of toxin-antitoxin system